MAYISAGSFAVGRHRLVSWPALQTSSSASANQIKNAWQPDRRAAESAGYDLIPKPGGGREGLHGVTNQEDAHPGQSRPRGAAPGGEGAPAAQAKAEGVLTETLKSLFAVVERYPEAQGEPETSAALQEELTGTEKQRIFLSPGSSTTISVMT